MGVEIELYVLLAIQILGSSIFTIFELETAWWRTTAKWFIITTATISLYYMVGHIALLVPSGVGVLGASFHFWWCRRHGIHPVHATPRRKYYQLRGWSWPD